MIEKFQDKVGKIPDSHPSLLSLIPTLQLPNIDFPVNSMAEGRILVPWEHRKFPNLTDGALRLP